MQRLYHGLQFSPSKDGQEGKHLPSSLQPAGGSAWPEHLPQRGSPEEACHPISSVPLSCSNVQPTDASWPEGGGEQQGDPQLLNAFLQNPWRWDWASSGQKQVWKCVPGLEEEKPFHRDAQSPLQVSGREGGWGAPAAQGDRQPPNVLLLNSFSNQRRICLTLGLPLPGAGRKREARQGAAEGWHFWGAANSQDDGGAGRCSDVLLREPGDSQRLKARESALGAPKRADKLVGVIVYREQCPILDLRRRFSFGTRDQSWSLKSFCVAEFYSSKNRHRESF